MVEGWDAVENILPEGKGKEDLKALSNYLIEREL